MLLDSKLSFEGHRKSVLAKVNETIGLFRKFWFHLAINCLLTIYKSFSRPNLDYGDVVYDDGSFHKKIESIQYNAAVVITGVIRGILSEKFYQELGSESLKIR